MAAIQLPGRNQVQPGHQQPSPTCQRDRMNEHIDATERRGLTGEEKHHPVQQCRHPAIARRSGQEFPVNQEFGQQIENRVSFQQEATRRQHAHLREFESNYHHRQRNRKAGKRPGNANIQQRASVADGRFHADDCAHRSQKTGGERNKIRKRYGRAVPARGKIMP